LTVKFVDYLGAAAYGGPVPVPPAEPEMSLPELMRMARGSYVGSIRTHLRAEGVDDLPRHGAFVLSWVVHGDEAVVDKIRSLGVTKQAASQLIDTLVLRGYLTRAVHAQDRRRMTIDLTARGRLAAAAVEAAIAAVDRQLTTMITSDQWAGLRAGLAALGRMEEKGQGS
jgi:DNA-binding MarR family transcriptional regulator